MSSKFVSIINRAFSRRLEAFPGRTVWSHGRELRLEVLTHNVMLLLRIKVF